MKPCICGQCGPVSHKRIKLSGPRTSTVYLANPKQHTVQRWGVDGCQITEGKRCDWLVCAADESGCEEVFVELKGSHFADALTQLETTLKNLRCECRGERPVCIVALRRNPMAGTDVALAKARFKTRYQARLLTLHDGGEYGL
jgi:hypothetical protein